MNTIKTFDQFISEKYDNYADLSHFDDFLYDERIDEGFKDFIRKAAITAAVATSCITAMAAPKSQPSSIENAKYQMEHTIDKLNQKYNHNIHFVIGTASNGLDSQKSAREQIVDYVKEKTGSKHVDDAMINKMIGVVSVASYQPKSGSGEWSQIIYFIDRSETADTDQEQSFINDCENGCDLMQKWIG